jgi:hypothetical protein
MKITVNEPPNEPRYRGLYETLCQFCGSEILICETKAGASIVLDEGPGPFRLEDDGTGRIRAVHRHALDGYAFHFDPDGSCRGSASD